MACRGVHFALTLDEADRIKAASGDEDLMAAVEEIEERWDREWLMETDKAWDAIHRCLTGGNLDHGTTSLHKCILGEASLHGGDDYIVNLLDPAEVKEVAVAIRGIDESSMRRSYFAIDPNDYLFPPDEEDFGYTWANFQDLRTFFEKAALHGRAVIFTVDQ